MFSSRRPSNVNERYTLLMNASLDIVLASGSPRRKELLEKAGIPFRVMVSDAEEIAESTIDPAEVAMENARLKAAAVARDLPFSSIVIGADTIVVLDGRIFGKPVGKQDARRMLRALSGRAHQVITGVCIMQGERVERFAEVTNVVFKQLSDEDIDAYIATGEPLDKAGAYGIQGKGGALVDHIDGSFDNVVGLPVARVHEMLGDEGATGSSS